MRRFAALSLLLAAFGCRSDAPADSAEPLVDADGDGVPAGDDCDDADPSVAPGAEERCDGRDNDCDGRVDADASDATDWWVDFDADGYGDARLGERSCAAPTGFVGNADDCDDADPRAFPGAALREPVPTGAAPLCQRDADGDGWADAAPAGVVLAGADCDDLDPGVHPDATEACDGVDTDCDGAPIGDERDDDGDGAIECAFDPLTWRGPPTVWRGGDCDDASDAVAPGAPELCDGLDNDCDGRPDPADALGAPTWAVDGDRDGYGSLARTVVSCTAPLGFVLRDTTLADCDDGDAAVFPGATETCNGVDDDCDGEADGSNAVDAGLWGPDRDTDAAPDVSSFGLLQRACAAPGAAWAPVVPGAPGDCDDRNALAAPGLTEVCDSADNDCDGVTDEPDAVDARTWGRDADGDGFGSLSLTARACAAPSGHVADRTDCDDLSAAAYPGAAEVCDAADNDCDFAIDEAGAAGETTFYLDYDGDGFGDPARTQRACAASSLWVTRADDCDDTSPAARPGGAETCNDGLDNDCDPATTCVRAGVVFHTSDPFAAAWAGAASPGLGSTLAIADLDADGLPDVLAGTDDGATLLRSPITAAGPAATLTIAQGAGVSAAFAGDLDGDRVAELILVGPGAGDGLLLGWTGPVTAARTAASADLRLTGPAGGGTGRFVAGGADGTGDGLPDLLVGASDAVWLVDLPLSTTRFDRDAHALDAAAGLGLGSSGALVGDLDGDGFGDLALGLADRASAAGGVLVVPGPVIESVRATDVGFLLRGASAADRAGYAVAAAGDIDADGLADLLIGAPGVRSGAGAAYLLRGPVAAAGRADAAELVLRGESPGDRAGSALGAGDIDFDGLPDVLVGASVGGGRAYAVPGTARGTLSLGAVGWNTDGTTAGDELGAALGAADFDDDGRGDLLLGAPGDDRAGADAGALIWLFGVDG